MKSRGLAIVTLFIVFALVQSSVVLAKPNKKLIAFAEFSIDHGNDCTVTTASIYVYTNDDYQPGDPIEEQPHVDFHYDILGQPTSPGCDALWYYYIDGSAPLNDFEFSAQKNLKSATLNKTMQVYDDEGGVFFDVTLNVEWTAKRGARGESNATLSISSPSLSPMYMVNPISTSTAGISKVGPK